MGDKPPIDRRRFQPDWWAARNAVIAEVSASQARLRKAYPLPEDLDRSLQRLLQQQSDAALAVALYGDDPKSNWTELCETWDAAATAVERYRAQARG
jgi:hypothetical protein